MFYDTKASYERIQSLLGRVMFELEAGIPEEDRLADSLYQRLEVMLMEVGDALIAMHSDHLAKEAVESQTELERVVDKWVRESYILREFGAI